ncbi:MAG: DNA repair protein RecO [Pseudomonadota bacterium]
MNWTDEGIVLSVRPHGETAAVVELFTRAHGRHLALVHGGRSRRTRPVLQIGNHVDVTWKGRLAEQLGHARVDLRRGYAAEAMSEETALAGLTTIAALLRLLPERDPHPSLYEVTLFVLGFLDDDSVWPALLVRWEMALLDELGYGLDLGTCAATGANDALVYVSPKSGRAISASAGEPYRDKLLTLPGFLVKGRQAPPTSRDVLDGLALGRFFLERRVLGPRGLPLPEALQRLETLLARDSKEPSGVIAP